MAIYKYSDNGLVKLSSSTFGDEGIHERANLQNAIIKAIDAIEKGLFVLCEEFGEWEDSKRRIDILCLDKNANLVVIELKTVEDGGHMELQAIRYAAMISTMTFDKAVKAHAHYCERNNIDTTSSIEDKLLQFLEWDNIADGGFAKETRIILVSPNFSKEITTTVMWLRENSDIDIKCIKIKPQRDEDNLYLDISQILPLPETADYQVQIKEKENIERQARRDSNRDHSRFSISINGKQGSSMYKRNAMYFVVSECIHKNIDPEKLKSLTKGKWLSVNRSCETMDEFVDAYILEYPHKKIDKSRWFCEPLHYNGKSYLFSNQHGGDIDVIIRRIFEIYPQLQGDIQRVE